LRGEFSQIRGFLMRAKTKSRDEISRGCSDLSSAGTEERQSHNGSRFAERR
jgi:hypothetical protein